MGSVGSFHRHSWYQDLETSSSSSYTYLLLPQGVALSCLAIISTGGGNRVNMIIEEL